MFVSFVFVNIMIHHYLILPFSACHETSFRCQTIDVPYIFWFEPSPYSTNVIKNGNWFIWPSSLTDSDSIRVCTTWKKKEEITLLQMLIVVSLSPPTSSSQWKHLLWIMKTALFYCNYSSTALHYPVAIG